MKLLFCLISILTVCALFSGCSNSPSTSLTPVSSPPSALTSPLAAVSSTPNSAVLPNAPVYSWEEAVKHIGETATVTGPIINWTEILISNYIVLGMGKAFQEQGYVGIALRVDKSAIPSDKYVGKTIAATGYINRNAFGGAAVDVSDISSIKVVQ